MTMSISERVVDAFLEFLPEGKTILELGTGEGTRLLAAHWNVYSVESNPIWHVGASELLRVPLKSVPKDNVVFWERFPDASRWYDSDVLKKRLNEIKYNAVLIDGPPGGSKRIGMWWYYSLMFDTSVPVIVDDVHRRHDWAVAVKIAEVKGVDAFKVVHAAGKMFAVIL